jgi:hypothetical protein
MPSGWCSVALRNGDRVFVVRWLADHQRVGSTGMMHIHEPRCSYVGLFSPTIIFMCAGPAEQATGQLGA